MQSLMAVLQKGPTQACQWLRGKLDKYIKSSAWVDSLHMNFNFGTDETEGNLRQDFQSLISTADNLCAA
ncbi:hypothetical protein [Streptomyces abikoensis]|uniref:Uncharacterized protein n=1 Tax=Streptomyces abikoensis TaxID=97398 RepID=A0ABW7T4Y9_9ACTN